MSNIERLVIALLVVFALLVIVVFRRRWQGALGWLLIGGAFIASVLLRDNATILQSVIAAVVIVVGIGLAGYDYLRFERPKRRQRRADKAAAGDPLAGGAPPEVRVRRRPSLLRRRHFDRQERH